MSELTLVVGNLNYSSWSARPWLVLTHTGIPFREVLLPFLPEDTRRERFLRYSPSGKVPALIDGDVHVWESLAICEYLAERFSEKSLWPADAGARALARAVSAEMHAGFANLRQHMVLNCRKRLPGKGYGMGVKEDIRRVIEIWSDCRARYESDGALLFGRFTIADAMFAPVALRFVTYEVALNSVAQQYVEAILALPATQTWLRKAREEPEVLPQYEY